MEAKRDKQEEEAEVEAEAEAGDAQHVKQLAPPSSSSSPSHEFSFTISLHSQETIPEKSPADEIFFHGHLLPLHLLSHLPISPRSSTNSMDSFTLPIRESSEKNNCNISSAAVFSARESHLMEEKNRGKSKSFSLFGLPRRKKDADAGEEEKSNEESKRRKLKFDILKKYIRFVKPFLVSLRNRGVGRMSQNSPIDRRPFSLSSGNLRMRGKRKVRGRRVELSAPASMRTSPTNSGFLVASGACTPSVKSDSTMEELQAAIQAAIAHCKDSIAAQDSKIKVP